MSPSSIENSAPAGSQEEHTAKKPFGKPFQPGQSGNPAGRRKGAVSLKATAKRLVSRKDCELVVGQLVSNAKSGRRDALAAAKLLAELLDDLGPFAAVQVNVNPPPEIKDREPIDFVRLQELQKELIEDRARQIANDNLNGTPENEP